MSGSNIHPAQSKAFTLIELLVVVGIIALLVSILMPSLSQVRELARSAACKVSIRNLQVGNDVYQNYNQGYFAPGAAKMLPPAENPSDEDVNNHRWFGARTDGSGPFSDGGALSPYIPQQKVRECPSFVNYLVGFESGCGGYGYNNNFVGQSRPPPTYQLKSDQFGNKVDLFALPSQTVAFTDAAFVNAVYIEYSFCESPLFPDWGGQPRPSIHFRHRGRANVAWLDEHVTEESLSFSGKGQTNAYQGNPIDYKVGWFGPKTNELFDCQ